MTNPNISQEQNTLRFTLKRRSLIGVCLAAPVVWIKTYRLFKEVYKSRLFAIWIAFHWMLPMLRMMKEHGYSNVTVSIADPDKIEID